MPEQIDDLVIAIHSLKEESEKVEELVMQEENYSNAIVGQLKRMMAPLEGPFKINPEVLKGRFSTVADCALSSQGIASFFYRSGKIIRIPLEAVPGDVAFRIITEVIPKVENALQEQRNKSENRSSTVTKIAMELRKILGR